MCCKLELFCIGVGYFECKVEWGWKWDMTLHLLKIRTSNLLLTCKLYMWMCRWLKLVVYWNRVESLLQRPFLRVFLSLTLETKTYAGWVTFTQFHCYLKRFSFRSNPVAKWATHASFCSPIWLFCMMTMLNVQAFWFSFTNWLQEWLVGSSEFGIYDSVYTLLCAGYQKNNQLKYSTVLGRVRAGGVVWSLWPCRLFSYTQKPVHYDLGKTSRRCWGIII